MSDRTAVNVKQNAIPALKRPQSCGWKAVEGRREERRKELPPFSGTVKERWF